MGEFGDLDRLVESSIRAAFPAGTISRVHMRRTESSNGDDIIDVKVVLADKQRLDHRKALYLNVEISRLVRERTHDAASPIVSYYSLQDAKGLVPEAA